jgi:hypothetical protein
MASPITLTNLSPREAVADALHRCVLGIDTKNKDLFASGCVTDESMILVAGPTTLTGWTAGTIPIPIPPPPHLY